MTHTYQMQMAFINRCYSFSTLSPFFAFQMSLMLTGGTLSQQYPKEPGT